MRGSAGTDPNGRSRDLTVAGKSDESDRVHGVHGTDPGPELIFV